MTLEPTTTIDTIDALRVAQFLDANFDAFAAGIGGAEAERIIIELGARDVDSLCDGAEG